MKTSEQINEIASALAKAQGLFENAKKDSANPFYKSKYSSLAEVTDTIKKPLSENGLSYIQFPFNGDRIKQTKIIDTRQNTSTETNVHEVGVSTRLMHSSGQWIEGSVTAFPKDDTPQAVGSTITYLRRYSLTSVLGIATEDDDGAAASGTVEKSLAKPAGKLFNVQQHEEGQFATDPITGEKVALSKENPIKPKSTAVPNLNSKNASIVALRAWADQNNVKDSQIVAAAIAKAMISESQSINDITPMDIDRLLTPAGKKFILSAQQ